MENQNKKELTLSRTFDASRELVFKTWTDPKLVQQWWGPNGVSIPTCEWNTKPGGEIYIVMKAGEELGSLAGQEWPMTGRFEEIIEPSKIVYTSNAIIDGKEIMQALTTVTFEEENQRTHMTVYILVTKTTPEAKGPLAGMEMGWNQQLDKLSKFLQNG